MKPYKYPILIGLCMVSSNYLIIIIIIIIIIITNYVKAKIDKTQ